ncbi:hypothetical protein CORC01_11822 [Colletotrichum orchidophilum]|uniref:Uncharacterized protein n=1 Tax=Colletotrichum orchidophilum TaxID=1209926 RepID=A0A1G4AUN1_9PEZI|nr:uncharacterized protein CORC01_11822 [Colletotrichum orchidophilum]OHE92880.1 hypothetical protein CORC01_11822 [Colletotrichum orchidophilum]
MVAEEAFRAYIGVQLGVQLPRSRAHIRKKGRYFPCSM